MRCASWKGSDSIICEDDIFSGATEDEGNQTDERLKLFGTEFYANERSKLENTHKQKLGKWADKLQIAASELRASTLLPDRR